MSTAQTMSHSTGCPSACCKPFSYRAVTTKLKLLKPGDSIFLRAGCMSRLVRSSQTRVRYEGSRLKCLWQGSPASEAGELEQVSTARGPQLVRAAAGESGPTLQRPGARQVAQPEAPSRPERKEQESNGTSKLPPPSAEPSYGLSTCFYSRFASLTRRHNSVNMQCNVLEHQENLHMHPPVANFNCIS